MRPIAAATGIAAILALAGPAAGFAQGEVLENEDILSLTEAGLPPEVIVAKIESTATAFDTSVERLVALVQAGVHADVLAAMARASASSATESPAYDPGGDTAPVEQPRADPQPVPRTSWQVGARFSDALNSGGRGPEMVVVPAGSFYMGCVSGMGCSNRERPIREVSFAEPFAVSIHEVTLDEYDRYTAATGRPPADDGGWGRGRRPALNVSWQDAQAYVAWLSGETGGGYRLLSEAEWEYVARAGSTTQFHFGDHPAELCRYGNHADVSLPEHVEWRNTLCSDRVALETAEVGSYAPNPWGLHDTHGNVWEWVEDCWNGAYEGSPTDGSPWTQGDCSRRVLRGGSWNNRPGLLRAAGRNGVVVGERGLNIGFRVARTLVP
ncbi:MAG: formylglycine-generating enzyme family protein [Acidobacteria bacterium]|nr:formylglycine-generating enzyme family protein [Acidobacteriota bacterium]MXZ38988.1 formylglycine-generating enzyme family protein [Holophagales bacterium]MYF04176.1 formylglycine-generating enzyme family protein [Holophagales bacterium]